MLAEFQAYPAAPGPERQRQTGPGALKAKFSGLDREGNAQPRQDLKVADWATWLRRQECRLQ